MSPFDKAVNVRLLQVRPGHGCVSHAMTSHGGCRAAAPRTGPIKNPGASHANNINTYPINRDLWHALRVLLKSLHLKPSGGQGRSLAKVVTRHRLRPCCVLNRVLLSTTLHINNGASRCILELECHASATNNVSNQMTLLRC